jgi:hypothetical protein
MGTRLQSEHEGLTIAAPPPAREKEKKTREGMAREAVEARFPERSDYKRKIVLVFEDNGALCFRVNFIHWRGEGIESAFVKVRDGVVEVQAEKPCRPLDN